MVLFVALLLVSSVFAQEGDGDSGRTDHLDTLYEKSASMARVITTGISIAFGVGFLLNLARALQQGLGMVILLSLSANVEVIAAGLYAIGSGIDADPNSPALLTGIWEQLARFFTSSILGGVGVYTTVSAIGSGMGAHLSSITGTPAGISRTISSGLILAGGGILTLMSVLFANSMISAVF